MSIYIQDTPAELWKVCLALTKLSYADMSALVTLINECSGTVVTGESLLLSAKSVLNIHDINKESPNE